MRIFRDQEVPKFIFKLKRLKLYRINLKNLNCINVLPNGFSTLSVISSTCTFKQVFIRRNQENDNSSSRDWFIAKNYYICVAFSFYKRQILRHPHFFLSYFLRNHSLYNNLAQAIPFHSNLVKL